MCIYILKIACVKQNVDTIQIKIMCSRHFFLNTIIYITINLFEYHSKSQIYIQFLQTNPKTI